METTGKGLAPQTLPAMLEAVVKQNKGRSAIVEGGRALSYQALEERIRSLAVLLHRRGVRQGHRVGLLLPNGIDFVIGYFAVVETGAIVVPLNDHYRINELTYFIETCDISLLITTQYHEALCRQVKAACRTGWQPLFTECKEEPSEKEQRLWGDLKPTIHPGAPVMFQFSSGSTGWPKRIARNHAQLLFELDSLTTTLALTGDDRFLGVAPFSHVNGMMRSMMASLRVGATLYPLARFDRQNVANVIAGNRITLFIAVPFMFSILARSHFRQPPDLSSLRLCISASAAMPVKQNQQFYETFGIYVRQLYGSTETGSISVNLQHHIEETLASVGTPLAGVEVEVFNEEGKRAAPEETGEFAIRSPGMITRYEEGDEINREAFREGYFFTGDLGKRGNDGLLYLVGRKKFFINKGGYKIDPREIEELLESHPKVDEAVVIGVPTAFGDEKVKAVVILKESLLEAELVEYCRGKIADFKIPSLMEFRDSLPKSSTGKILRTLLVQGE